METECLRLAVVPVLVRLCRLCLAVLHSPINLIRPPYSTLAASRQEHQKLELTQSLTPD